jgi:colicin import membrane protein
MSATRRHLEFAPPATPGMVRSVLLALVAHLLLVAVLAVGVAWKRETPPVAVEAELWAAVPQEAAPPPPPEPEPEPPAPEPPLPARPAPPPAPPAVDTPKAADIALAKEKEKEKVRLQKEKELQQAKLEQERKAQQDKLQREKQAADKLALDKQRKEQETKAAREKAEKTEKADKAKAEALAKQKASKAAELAAQKNRDDQLKRMAALAGDNSGSGGAGNAAKSAGPGASYFGRVAARIKPNVTYTDIISGNPITEIEVSLSPNGDILSRRISKRSGNTAWDNAALNAIDKTEKLPLDNGKVWSPLTIVLSPQTLLGP